MIIILSGGGILMCTHFSGPFRSIYHVMPPLEKQRRTRRYIKIWFIFFSSTATIVCSRNTARKRSHISFFYSSDTFCEVVRRPGNSHEELTGLFFHRLRDQLNSSFVWATPSVQNYRPYILFKFHVKVWTSSSPHVFFCFSLVFRTNLLPFFSR